MRTVENLIDECAQMCGGDSKLAQRLGVPRQRVHEWRKAGERLQPEQIALLCDVLQVDGEEARRLLATASTAGAKPRYQAVMRRAFFVCWALGVAVFATPTNDARADVGARIISNVVNSLYIVRSALRRLLSRARGALSGILHQMHPRPA